MAFGPACYPLRLPNASGGAKISATEPARLAISEQRHTVGWALREPALAARPRPIWRPLSGRFAGKGEKSAKRGGHRIVLSRRAVASAVRLEARKCRQAALQR